MASDPSEDGYHKRSVNEAAAYLRSRLAEIAHVLAADPDVMPILATTPILVELATDDVDEGRVVHAPSITPMLAEGADDAVAISGMTRDRLRKIAAKSPRLGVERDGFVLNPIHISIMLTSLPESATLRAIEAVRLASPEHRQAVAGTCAKIDAMQ